MTSPVFAPQPCDGRLAFAVHRQGEHWVVCTGRREYGRYRSKELAVLDAVEAASDARQIGRDAEVWDGKVRVF